MKKILLFVCFVILSITLPQDYVYADKQFERPSFVNGGIMSLEMDGFSYYYKDTDTDNDDVQPNNTLIRFDYNSGERLYLADNVVSFISDGDIIYYISGVTGNREIWKMNCDGTNKEHIYSFSSNCVASIQYYKNDGVFGLIDLNGTFFEITVPLDKTEQNFNSSANDFVGNNYVGLYGVKETEAKVGNDLYQSSADGTLKRTNLDTGEISILAEGVSKFVTDGQNIYYDTYNESTKKNEIYYIDCNGQNQKLVLSGKSVNLLGCLKNKYLYYEVVDFSSQSLGFYTWIYDIDNAQERLMSKHRMGTFKTYGDKLFYIKYDENASNKSVGMYSSDYDGSNEKLLVKNAYEFNIIDNELYCAKYNDNSEYNNDFYMEKTTVNGENPVVLTDIIRTTLGVCQKISKDKITIVNYNYISEKKYKQPEISVFIDGNKISFDQQPLAIDGRTLVPLRAIFEALGATVEWDGDTQTVTSTKGSTVISMTIGKKEMYKNGKESVLDVAPLAVGGRTLVPVRAVAEAFSCSVDWDNESKSVIISTTNK